MFPIMSGSAFAWFYPESPALACTVVWAILAAQFVLQIVNQDWKLLGVSAQACYGHGHLCLCPDVESSPRRCRTA
jgi:hypothetical protein